MGEEASISYILITHSNSFRCGIIISNNLNLLKEVQEIGMYLSYSQRNFNSFYKQFTSFDISPTKLKIRVVWVKNISLKWLFIYSILVLILPLFKDKISWVLISYSFLLVLIVVSKYHIICVAYWPMQSHDSI